MDKRGNPAGHAADIVFVVREADTEFTANTPVGELYLSEAIIQLPNEDAAQFLLNIKKAGLVVSAFDPVED